MGLDIVRGGPGHDRALYDERQQRVRVTVGRTLDADGEPGELDDITGDIEEVAGGAGNDQLIGGDTLLGNDGDDTLDGAEGNDVLLGGTGRDELYGADGNDRLVGEAGGDNLRGEAGNDVLDATTGEEPAVSDYVACGDGYDGLLAVEGVDTIEPDCESLKTLVTQVDRTCCTAPGIGHRRAGSTSTAGSRSLAITCPKEATEACAGQVKMKAAQRFKGHRRGTLLGESGFSIAPGAACRDPREAFPEAGACGQQAPEGDRHRDGPRARRANHRPAEEDRSQAMRRPLITGALAMALAAGIATAADAATTVDYEPAGPTGERITVVAEPGRSNSISIQALGDGVVAIRDVLEPVASGDERCSNSDEHEVVCQSFNVVMRADLGDGDDVLFSEAAVTADGGAGNDLLTGSDHADVLTGGAGEDLLDGRAGPDTLSGGADRDTASYAARLDAPSPGAGVTVNRGPAADDGFADEGDLVDDDIEDLVGSPGDDELTALPQGSRLAGGPGNDTLHGGTGPDLLAGDTGNDQLRGADGSDVLVGGGGDDRSDGGDGGDLLDERGPGSTGADVLDGGDGEDRLTYADRLQGVTVTVGSGDDDGEKDEHDSVDASVEGVVGGTGDDVLIGSAGRDTLEGGDGDDTLDGGLAPDLLLGGNGSDTVSYAGRPRRVIASLARGEAGEAGEPDRLRDAENLVGGDAGDELTGSAQDNRIDGGGGDDTIRPGLGGDRIDGGGGSDTLGLELLTDDYSIRLDAGEMSGVADARVKTLAGIENVLAGPGDDSLTAGATGGLLDGGPGNDTLAGGPANDVLQGGPGDDAMHASAGDDSFAGGDGAADSVSYAAATEPVRVTIADDEPDGVIAAGERDDVQVGVERVTAGAAADTLRGTASAELLDGGDGADTIDGAGGPDALIGGSGDDELAGGDGDDSIQAGAGRDRLFGDRGRDLLDATTGEQDAPEPDRLSCGEEGDAVNADALDAVDGDCERRTTFVFERTQAVAANARIMLPDGDLTLSGSRRLAIKLSCNAAATSPCTGVLELVAGQRFASGRKGKLLASRAVTVDPGATRIVSLSLAKSVAKAAAARNGLKIDVSVSGPSRDSAEAVLRAPKPKPKRPKGG